DLLALCDHVTDLQCSKLQDHTNVLQHKVNQWCQVQVLYMPSVAPIRTAQSTDTSIEEKAYQIRLFLPSQLKEHTPDAICDK
ncbi:hypothetical protein F4604DRAFT_1598709, partial [Suillus subluteus]